MAFEGAVELAARQAERAAEGRLRYSYDCRGRLLRLASGMIVVPYEMLPGDAWGAVVVDPGPDPECRSSYPRGGYNIVVSADAVEFAAEIEVPDA